MALVKWSQINNMYDLQAYIQAEMNEAQAKCAAAYPQYVAAHQYLLNMMANPSASEAEAVAGAKAMTESARAVWRASCSVDAQSAALVEEETAPGADSGGSSGIGKWLILGAVGVGLYFLLRKKK